MYLWVHTDDSYLVKPKSKSRTGGYCYFSNKPKLPLKSDKPPTKHNHPVLVLCKVIDSVISATQESKTGRDYIYAKEALPIHQTAI